MRHGGSKKAFVIGLITGDWGVFMCMKGCIQGSFLPFYHTTFYILYSSCHLRSSHAMFNSTTPPQMVDSYYNFTAELHAHIGECLDDALS
jgi:hypothetical protein